ncbi:MAG: hypothetical protein NTU44_18745 [Bacteroidetes bacterium]|nr:hypothetical protein [Bacteroidota bacterium]
MVTKNCHALAFFLALLILWVSTSCKKDNDSSDPVITFSEPTENQSFNVFDTIHVVAGITSHDPLTGIKVTLVDDQFVPVLPMTDVSLISLHNNSWSVDQYIPIDEIQLQSGNYYVWIQANTASTFKNKYQLVRLIEVEKKLEKILLITRSQVNTTSLCYLDSLLQLHPLKDYSLDFGYSVLNQVHRQLYLTGRNIGKLLAIGLDSNQVLWQKQGAGTPELPFYQGLKYEDGLLFACSSDGRLNGYNEEGNLDFFMDFGTNQYPLRCCRHQQYLAVAVELKNGPEQFLNAYYYPSGAYQIGEQVTWKTEAVFSVTFNKMLVAANENGIGSLEYYYPADPAISPACVFPPEKIVKIIPVDKSNYLIASSNQVYWFQVNTNTLTVFVAAVPAVTLAYESLSKRVIVGENKKVSLYAFPTGQFLNSVNLNDSLKDCQLLYNR